MKARRRLSLFTALGLIAVALGVAAAVGRAWVCDDAFISFRYAQHLVRGHGLVFNPGERVEGYSNPLWTLLMAGGLLLGRDLERWSIGWGLLFSGGTLALLVLAQRRLREHAPEWGLPLPAAALVAAVHPDFAIHATSGLETAAYTFLLFAAFLALTAGPRPRPALAATLVALGALTRPDGILFAPFGLAYVALASPRRLNAALTFVAVFLLLWAPATVARVAYYGDYFPNTYYAKSADQPWWGQGLLYVRLYFDRYWALLLGLCGGVLALGLRWRSLRSPAEGRAGETRVLGAAALAVIASAAYLLYVARVGGDFMYARMLIPVTPLLLFVGEVGLGVLVRAGRLRMAVVLATVLAVALTPPPVTGQRLVSGIIDEWDYYAHVRPGWAQAGRRDGATLRRYFAGLPVGIAFMGSEARLVYYADPPLAVESETGLTDAFVARQKLAARGRVGHEKHAPLDYLVGVRRLHLTFHPAAGSALGLDQQIPYLPIVFDDVQGRLLRWDAALLDALRARGARFPEFPAVLDVYLARIDSLPIEQVKRDYARFRMFYFEWVDDPVREAAFRRRLGRPGSAAPPAGGSSRRGQTDDGIRVRAP